MTSTAVNGVVPGNGEVAPRRSAFIALDEIRQMPNQPRLFFDEEEIGSLAKSMEEGGNQVAIIVSVVRGDSKYKYELIGGERRWRAAKLIKMETIWAEIRDIPDPKRRFMLSAVENFQRVQLSPYESMLMLVRARKENPSLTQAALGKAFGKDQGWVSDLLSLYDTLPEEMREAMRPDRPEKQQLGLAIAIQLARLTNEEIRKQTFERWQRSCGLGRPMRLHEVKHNIETALRAQGLPIRQRKSSHEFDHLQMALATWRSQSDRIIDLPSSEFDKMFSGKHSSVRTKALADLRAVISNMELLADTLMKGIK